MIRAATCFSGIGAPECAMPEWSWVWSAEIEPFPAAVLAERHPGSSNLGNVLAADFFDRAEPVDVLVGGPPCQAFSVAGLRGGLSDPRGNLSLRWVQIIHAVRPRYSLTENVPGWLSTKDNAFGCFLGALVGADDALPAPPGGTWPSAGMVAGPLQRACWRVLNAQYFGLAQRRERVFVVGCPADGGDPAALLFERAGLRGYPEKGSQAGQRIADTLTVGANQCSGFKTDIVEAAPYAAPLTGNPYGDHESRESLLVSMCFNAHPSRRMDAESETLVPVAYGISADCLDRDGEGAGGTPGERSGLGIERELSQTLRAKRPNAVAYRTSPNYGAWSTGDRTDALTTQTDPNAHVIRRGTAVRRLTPTECERLQGFPDDYTAIQWRGKPAADGPRYKALGNSMAVPVLRWLLTRIEAHEAALRAAA